MLGLFETFFFFFLIVWCVHSNTGIMDIIIIEEEELIDVYI